MRDLFTFVLFLGAALLLIGFILPMLSYDSELVRSIPSEAPEYLGYTGMGLMVLGLAGRSATRPLGNDE
ncbi:MAG: hypothetical protein KC420_10190 [Myxococcales bacterium]|nr:hypothetical protein [Myxococcales bacterium]